MSYKVGFSIDVTHTKPFSLLNEVLEQKLDYVEFKADNPILDPERISRDNKRKLLDVLSTSTISVTYHGPYIGINLVGPGEWIVQASIERIRQSVLFAAELEAKYFLLHGGRLFRDFLSWEDITSNSWNYFLDNLKRVKNITDEVGIQLVIENTTRGTNSNLVDSIAKMQKLVSDFDEIMVVVDIGHLNLTSNVYDIEQGVKDNYFRNHIKGFHIHNNHGQRDEHLNYDKGAIDYIRLKKNVFSQLKDKIYICEVNTINESLNFKQFLLS